MADVTPQSTLTSYAADMLESVADYYAVECSASPRFVTANLLAAKQGARWF